MKGSFLKHFAIIGGGTVIGMVIGFLTTPVITRIVAPNEYGQFSIFTLYANIALMVLCLGLDQAVVRYFYEKETNIYRRGLLYKCVKMPVIVCVVISVVVIVLDLTNIWHFELGTTSLYLLCLFTIVQILYRFSLLMVRLQYKSKLYSLLGIIQKIVYVLLALLLVWLKLFSDTYALIISTILSVFVCLIVSIVAESNLWKINRIKQEDCLVSSKELLKYAYPFILSMGVTTLFQAADKLALNIFCSYSDVGIYSSTMTLVHVFAVIQTSFNTLWAPMAVEHYKKEPEDKSFYIKGNQVITVVMFFIGLTLILCKDVFAVLLGEKYRAAAYILPFLIFNPIMYTISETTVNGLVFMKKSKLQVVVALVSCAANVIGNSILVPLYGCQGAAISTGISYIIFFTMRTLLSNKYYYVNFKLGKFYLLTLAASLYAFYNTFWQFSWISVVGYIGCIALMLFMYKDTIKFSMQYVLSLIRNRRKKNDQKAN